MKNKKLDTLIEITHGAIYIRVHIDGGNGVVNITFAFMSSPYLHSPEHNVIIGASYGKESRTELRSRSLLRFL